MKRWRDFGLFHLQDVPIEVDENGTLDLSMKKGRGSMTPKVPLGDALTPPDSFLSRAGSVHINPALYQVLCEREAWDTPLNFSKAQGMQDREVLEDHRLVTCWFYLLPVTATHYICESLISWNGFLFSLTFCRHCSKGI